MLQRVAIITGGSRGIGHAISRRLLADGYNISVLSTRDVNTGALFSGFEAARFQKNQKRAHPNGKRRKDIVKHHRNGELYTRQKDSIHIAYSGLSWIFIMKYPGLSIQQNQ